MWYRITLTPIYISQLLPTRVRVLYSRLDSRLEHERGNGSEHGASTTDYLHGSAGERYGRGSNGGRLDDAAGRRRGGGVASRVATDLLEVGASNAGLVGQVEHKGEVTEVSIAAWVGGGVRVSVPVSH